MLKHIVLFRHKADVPAQPGNALRAAFIRE